MKIGEIAIFLKGNLIGDGEDIIHRVAALEKAKEGEISFVEKQELLDDIEKIYASCLIVPIDFDGKTTCPLIRVKKPKLAFAKIAEVLHSKNTTKPRIHETAIIAKNATIGKDVSIGAFCCVGSGSQIGDQTQLSAGSKVGENVRIGQNCSIKQNVCIGDNCDIRDKVILHPGVVIGTDGFGYVKDTERHVKFPQIGTVVIESDVEIGANSCVDRGALGETRIGAGTKIDNQVQVAHNVQIGKRVIIAAQTGISGSVTIEDDCIIAGQVGFADHVTIKKGAVIGAKSAVFPGKIVRKGIWCGIPVQPLDKYKKQNAYLRSLPRLIEEIKKLKERIKSSE